MLLKLWEKLKNHDKLKEKLPIYRENFLYFQKNYDMP
jgi:hypothetical protein